MGVDGGGGIAAYLVRNPRKPNGVAAAVGILLIAVGFVYPNLLGNNQALVNAFPVIGAFLVIAYSCEERNFVGKFLSWKPLVFIGLISYSVYLWHQPLIAFFRLASEYEPNPYILAAVSLLSIPLAYISWRFIENPARNVSLMPAKLFYPVLVLIIFLGAGVGLVMHKTYGFQDYFQDYSYGGDPQSYVDRPYRYQKNEPDIEGKPRLLVLGNSFARDFINMIEEAGLDETYEIVYEPAGCNVSDDKLQSLLGSSTSYLVLAGDWGQAGNPAADFVKVKKCVSILRPRLIGQTLFVLGTKNFGWNNNFVKQLPADEMFSASTRPLDSVLTFNQLASSEIDGYIDILELLMDKNGEVPVFTDDDRFITYDTNHLTKPGASWLGSLLFEKTDLRLLKMNEAAIGIIDK